MRDLEGRHALVCGASSGIGRASAIALAARGATVTGLARSGDRLAELVAEIEAADGSARAVEVDMEDLEGLAAAAVALVAEHGPVEVLVNNTGGPPGGRLLDARVAELEKAFRRHVLAAQTLVVTLLPGMEEKGYGRIVNVVSTSVREPIPGLGVSNTIRAAMAGWAKTLSDELPPGVTINNVLPGYTATARLWAIGEAVAERTGRSLDDVRAEWIAKIPEGRFAEPEELAATVAFLASPDAAYVRGQSIAVDGGRMRSI